jgi:Ca2+/Na+ antiporter
VYQIYELPENFFATVVITLSNSLPDLVNGFRTAVDKLRNIQEPKYARKSCINGNGSQATAHTCWVGATPNQKSKFAY